MFYLLSFIPKTWIAGCHPTPVKSSSTVVSARGSRRRRGSSHGESSSIVDKIIVDKMILDKMTVEAGKMI